MGSVISVENLKKVYPGKPPQTAVDGISFEIGRGEILGFLGPNGSGKTTTIQMLLGTLTKTSGSISYFGNDFYENREKVLRHVSFASTYLSLPYTLTVSENLEIIGLLYGFSRKESRKAFEPLLEQFNIDKYRNRLVSILSAGQLTRLMMVKAFFVEPKVILLDEPTASLDPEISHDICQFLLEQREKKGLSILFTSHKMEEVSQVCDRVIFLDRGKIIADDTPKSLAKQASVFRVRLIVVEAMEKAVELARKANFFFRSENKTLEVQMQEEEIPNYLGALTKAGVLYSSIQIEEPSLDDYFLKIARRARET